MALAGLGVLFVVLLIRDLTHPRALPPPAPPRTSALIRPTDQATSSAPSEPLAAYNVIIAKALFNPSRSEGGSTASAPSAPPAPKPMLLGVVVDGPKSRAYLEDPTSKRVLSYQVGDSVSGGKLEQINSERILIVRPDGPMEVMLRDPSRPKLEASPTAASAPGVGAAPRVNAPPSPLPPGAGPPSRGFRRPMPEQAQGARQ